MKKIFLELKNYIPMCIGIVLALIVVVFAELNIPNYLSHIVDIGIVNQDFGFILKSGFIMLGFALISVVFNIITGFFSAKISAGISKNLRSKLFSKIQGFSLAEMDKFETSSLITRTTNDVTQVQNFLIIFLKIIVMSPLMALGGIVMVYIKSPQMSSVLFVSMPVLFLTVGAIGIKAIKLSKQMQKKLDRVNLVMREKLTGTRVIRSFCTEQYEEKRFDISNIDLTKVTVKMQRIISILMPFILAILNFTIVGIIWIGSKNIQFGMEIGDIMASIQYVMQIMVACTMLSIIFIMTPRAMASATRINEVLETENVIFEKKNTIQSTNEVGTVEFKNVTFGYNNSDEPAISNISFKSQKGETTAIIGSTGSGKTTLLNLIPRFYDVKDGEVLVDGINIKDYSIENLRKKIGYVPQKAVLFKGSIEKNIKFGKENSTKQEVLNSATIAQSMEFINEKKGEFDFDISQGGSNVSGGQKQRLAIARAIVRKPEIYLFDDSFSALDFKTDSTLRGALKNTTKNSTVIIVAQRVSTIKNADRIIVLEDGKQVGMGTHDELLKDCDVYKEIVYSQLSKEEI